MPKKSKKGPFKSLGDVTLNDFANSSVPKNRIKKSSKNVNTVLKEEVEIVEKNWDDKDEEDFEGEFVSQENEDGVTTYVIRKKEQKTANVTSLSGQRRGSHSTEEGRDYPIDVWYLLSDYIKPEDVCTFASICQSSFAVVCSAGFWFSLYRRYYRNIPNMPEPLQPKRLIRKYGLKKNVIRALYHMYPPFIERIKRLTIPEEHPELLLKSYECDSIWFTKRNNNFIYFFKLMKSWKNLPHSKRKEYFRRKEGGNLLEILDDVSANPDENCKVLEVYCKNLIPVQYVIGLALKSVSLTLSSASQYRYNRLQLVFGPYNSATKTIGGADHPVVILDPVINVKVRDWWHPLYPINLNMEDLRLHED